MSNLNINSAVALKGLGFPNQSPVHDNAGPPKFVRQAPVEKPNLVAQVLSGPYIEDRFPDHPKLIAATLFNGNKILNESYAEEAGKHDLFRVMNDVSHGKLQNARKRIDDMSKVDMSEHFKRLNVDPELFGKLSKVLNNPRLPLADVQEAFRDLIVKSGAYDFVRNSQA